MAQKFCVFIAILLVCSCDSAQTVAIPARQLPVTHHADVVVIGERGRRLGGCFAAIAAAREGADVLFIEAGGNLQLHTPISLGVVIGVHGWRPSMDEGLFKEFARAIAKEGQHSDPPITLDQLMEKGELIIRYHDIVTTALLHMMQDAKVRMLFHTRVCDTTVEDKTIRDLVVISPQGMHAVGGKVFIDSTGLADVAAMAGVPLKTEEGFEGLQAFISGVDDAEFNQWANDPSQKPLGDDDRKWLETIVGPFDKLQFPWDQWWPEFLGKRFTPAFVRKTAGGSREGRSHAHSTSRRARNHRDSRGCEDRSPHRTSADVHHRHRSDKRGRSKWKRSKAASRSPSICAFSRNTSPGLKMRS